MRTFESEEIRNRALELYRQGYTTQDVSYFLTGSETNSRELGREMSRDPEFKAACMEAMSNRYESTLIRLHAHAEHIDVEGENKGAWRAAELIVNHYNRALDRQHRWEVGKRALKEGTNTGSSPKTSLVLGPAGVDHLIDRLTQGPTTDVDSEEIEVAQLEQPEDQHDQDDTE